MLCWQRNTNIEHQEYLNKSPQEQTQKVQHPVQQVAEVVAPVVVNKVAQETNFKSKNFFKPFRTALKILNEHNKCFEKLFLIQL
jgi:hypothetical protein